MIRVKMLTILTIQRNTGRTPKMFIHNVQRVTLVALLLSGCANAMSQAAQDDSSDTSFEFNPGLLSIDWEAEARRLVTARRTFLRAIERRLRQEPDPAKKAAVCYLLGEYRAAEAIEPLLDLIDLEAPETLAEFITFGSLPRWGKYPAYEALVKIGTPAIPAVVDRLAVEEEEPRRELQVSVIRKILGRERGADMLAEASRDQSDVERQEKLELARDLVLAGTDPDSAL